MTTDNCIPTTEIEVNVTQRDIRLGKRQNCHGCPFHRAIARRLIPGAELRVQTMYVEYVVTATKLDGRSAGHKISHRIYHVPLFTKHSEVKNWIMTYDGRGIVEPIKAKLHVPNELLRHPSK